MHTTNFLLALLSAVIFAQIPTVAPGQETTRPARINYDTVGPNEDATNRPYDVVTAVSERKERDAWLFSAAFADDFRETTATAFTYYRGLVAGDADADDEEDEAEEFESTVETFGDNIGRQPTGPLTGRIIFCSAGHGWTNDNTSTSLWYTQRPVTHGVVEDFGNLDQMNLYADICFRAGATVVPLRPIGFQHVERVIDNDSGHAAFHGEWADSKSTVSFGFTGAETPYRFARATAEETAVARFRPVIPITDIYPVYAWARSGADRVIQTYRIAHAGGVNEVDIDHRRIGNGWIYLGSYTFRAGRNGYVEVTNQVRDARMAASGGVVIADAIRFGNGMGDVNRGGGISGYPREEESSRYWVERSLAAGLPPIYNGFPDRWDQSNNVGSAPRFAAHMNREKSGNFFDRVFMSFHSNASGGRGVVGLYNTHAIMRPDHQIELAKLAADELNIEMTRAGLKLRPPWHVGNRLTMAHINFGEIRRDYLNNEMSATIVEVAYHDNPDDAALLRQLSVRRAVAESTYRATLRYFNEVGHANLDYYSPPLPPLLLAVRQNATTDAMELEWAPAAQDPLSSPTDEITYRIYRSADGVAFDTGRDVGAVTKFVVDDVAIHTPAYFRVTAVSPGGESRPSAVLGASLSNGRRILVAQGVSTVTDDAVLTQTAEANLGHPLRPGGAFARLVPGVMNNGEQVRSVGSGIDWLHLGFDSVDASILLPETRLNEYGAVCFMMGRNPVTEDMATTAMLAHLHDYVTSGGCLLISGACLAECTGETTGALERWGVFAGSVLQTRFETQTTVTQLIKSGDRDLTTVTLQLGNRSLRYFEPRPTEVLRPLDAGRPVLAYEYDAGVATVATLKNQLIRTAVLGFPLEELDDREEQAVLAAQILLAMGMDSKPVSKAEIIIEDSSKPATKTTAAADSIVKIKGKASSAPSEIIITDVLTDNSQTSASKLGD